MDKDLTIDEAIIKVAKEMLPWWWLSFADGEKPKGEQFLGACLVQGATLPDAIKEAWRLKINPGGEVMSGELGGYPVDVPEKWANRLLSHEDMVKMGMEPERWDEAALDRSQAVAVQAIGDYAVDFAEARDLPIPCEHGRAGGNMCPHCGPKGEPDDD